MKADPAMLGNSGYDRQPLDQYHTPKWCTEALLSQVLLRGPVWELAAGRGDIVGADLGCASAQRLDFLVARSLPGGTVTIATNPPFNRIERFIWHALALTRDCGGAVAMLARNEFDCAAGRKHLFDRYPFTMKVVLTKRPRWSEMNIASPRHNFSWFYWSWRHPGPAVLRYAP